MASIDEHILKAAKEIVVKFIECGRLSPSGFAETFQNIYKTVDETVKSQQKPLEKGPEAKKRTRCRISASFAFSARQPYKGDKLRQRH
jgi:hypothetical protein